MQGSDRCFRRLTGEHPSRASTNNRWAAHLPRLSPLGGTHPASNQPAYANHEQFDCTVLKRCEETNTVNIKMGKALSYLRYLGFRSAARRLLQADILTCQHRTRQRAAHPPRCLPLGGPTFLHQAGAGADYLYSGAYPFGHCNGSHQEGLPCRLPVYSSTWNH
jgi:hypothetical protein